MEESRQKLFVQLFVMATVVSLSLILTVYIASTYYKDVSDLSYWTPVPSDSPTPSPVLPTQTLPVPTATNTATHEVVVIKNCTYSALYWIYHPEAWPPQIVVGSLTYTKDEALAILQTPNPDSARGLFTQLHAAILNYLSGADFSAVRQTAIEASNWLNKYPAGTVASETDQQAGQNLKQVLEAYNTGLVGPGRCPDEPAVSILAFTGTPTPTTSLTPSATQTDTPVPKPGWVPSKTPRPPKPRATKPPTSPPQPATNTPKPPTNTPRPPPTNTPRPPTPVPTN